MLLLGIKSFANKITPKFNFDDIYQIPIPKHNKSNMFNSKLTTSYIEHSSYSFLTQCRLGVREVVIGGALWFWLGLELTSFHSL